MKWLWRYGLALSLGLLATTARAEPTVWRPIASAGGATPSKAAAQIQKPVARSAAPDQPPAPVVSIGRPVPIASSAPAPVGNEVQPVSLRTPVVRGSSPEPIHQPMPSGPVIDPPGQLHGWRRSNEPLSGPSATMNSAGMPAGVVVSTGLPLPGGPMPGSPMPGVPLATGPIASNAPPPVGAPMPAGAAPLYNPACPDCGHGGACGPMGGFAPGTCLDGNCGGCGCPPGNRWLFGIEYLAWTTKSDQTPPLVATSPAANPTTLFGGTGLGDGMGSGIRGTVGYWFDDNHCLGLEFSGFYLGGADDRYSNFSTGVPALVRPAMNPLGGRADEGVAVIATLGPLVRASVGSVSVDRDQNFWGGEANFRRNWLCGPNGYLDALIGFRMLGLDENLTVREDLTVVRDDSGAFTPFTRFQISDQFATSNRFYGGQVGLEGEYRVNRWIFGARGKIGLGSTEQIVQLNSSTTRSVPGAAAQTLPGGFLVGSSNIGRYSREMFTVVPEIGLQLGYQCTDHMRLTLGYTFLYWSNVVRPGQQVDPFVNPQLVPFRGNGTGPARPAFTFNGSDYWAQGLTLGLEFRY